MLVWITDPAHPHYDEYGTWHEDDTAHNGLMHKITLNDCKHGTSGCYAMRGQVQEVKSE